MPNLIVIGIWQSRGIFYMIESVLVRCSIRVILISTRSPCSKLMLDSRVFGPLELSRDLASLPLTFAESDRSWGSRLRFLDALINNPGIALDTHM